MSGDHLDYEAPLAEGLKTFPPYPEVPDELCDAILRRTRATVRRRPRRLRTLAACVVAVAYAAGLGTALLWSGTDVAPAPLVAAPAPEIAPVIPAVTVADAAPASPQALLARVPDAAAPEQVRLLTQAGDRYLTDYGDVARALNCYRQVLELTPDSQSLTLESSDTWLLTSLKRARLSPQTNHQEVRHDEKSS